MQTRIISAFPGTGKTYYHNNNPHTTLDSDSSNFSWISDSATTTLKERNPNFPQNYIEHIKENIGKYRFIFVSSHKVVREALKANCLFFYLIYPSSLKKEMYIARYKDRGSSQEFISLLHSQWENWIDECEHEEFGCSNIRMTFNNNLSDELRHIVASEIGDVK